jgi:peptidoglycan hydrolase-like protein with peptidoglycan-binding domain
MTTVSPKEIHMKLFKLFVLLVATFLIASCTNTASPSRTAGSTTSAVRPEPPQPSAEVRDAQQRLRTLGLYNGPDDGLWGPETQAAVQRFQQSRGMPVTSRLDNPTVSAIRSAKSTPITLSDPTDVRTIQNRLRQLNFYNGPADGVWGPGTQVALENFQRARGLPVGQMTAATVGAMGIDAATFPTRAAPGVGAGAGAVSGPGATPAAGVAGNTLEPGVVRGIQRRLRQNGFYSGRVDGVWGPATQNALLQFQRSRGLEATGQLNPTTISALGFDPNNLSRSAAAVR